MAIATTTRQRATGRDARTIRASISFPTPVYRNLERIAKQKKVSLAWVVREAAESYVAEQDLRGRVE
jgi:metal-responsive CopG/Arc/MetJ family transcriptional regulator